MHPQATIDALRKALAGDSVKETAIVSTVCERLSKRMCAFQFREVIAGRPCICLEDSQGNVACINSGYSSRVLMQALQLASNLHGKKGRRRRMTVKTLHHLPTRPSRKLKKGGLRTGRPMPIETLISKGFPRDTPISSDEVGFRFAGNAVPCDWFSELFKLVVNQLEDAGVSHRLVPGAKHYSTWVDEPLHLHDFIVGAEKLGADDTKKVTT